MIQKTIREISDAWREDKRPYVKLSTLAAYMLILENHILPKFGESNELQNIIGNVPHLRFPKFSGEWEICKVSELLDFYSTNSLKVFRHITFFDIG